MNEKFANVLTVIFMATLFLALGLLINYLWELNPTFCFLVLLIPASHTVYHEK